MESDEFKKCGVSFYTKKSEDNKFVILTVEFDGECGRNILNLNFEISEESFEKWKSFVGKFRKFIDDDIKCDCENCKDIIKDKEKIEFILSPETTLYYAPDFHRITVKIVSTAAETTFIFKHNFEYMFGYVLSEVLSELKK